MFELSKQFRFEAAHTLERRIDTESSRRVHGHSYRAEVTVRGPVDAKSGMVIDLTLFERALCDARSGLDHRLLDDVPNLGPSTLENLSAWIWRRLEARCPGLCKVAVYRDSEGDACTFYGTGPLWRVAGFAENQGDYREVQQAPRNTDSDRLASPVTEIVKQILPEIVSEVRNEIRHDRWPKP
jgi:6-pyruvoyltetrahydropterin/6-carboxytetrahydropterin synthase